MTVAVLIISALSLIVQIAIGASLLYVARGFLKSVEALLGILGGAAFGYLIAVTVLGLATPRDVGVSVAATAACVIGIQLIQAIEADRERQRRYREAVWDRRIEDASGC